MKDKPKFSVNLLKSRSFSYLKRLGKYKVGLFIIFIAAVYAYVYLNISSYTNQQPSQTLVQSKVSASAVPHIDQSVVNKIESLKNNSVSVQTLFNQARNNPFQ